MPSRLLASIPYPTLVRLFVLLALAASFAAPAARAGAGPRALGVPEVGERRLKKLLAESKKPVIVVFGATWCLPCHRLETLLAGLMADHPGRFVAVRADVDYEPHLAYRLGIEVLPTSVIFRDGREVRRATGALSRSSLEEMLRLTESPIGPAASGSTRHDPAPAVAPALKISSPLPTARVPGAAETRAFALLINGDDSAKHQDNVGIAANALVRAGYRADRLRVVSTGAGRDAPAGSLRQFPPTLQGLTHALAELSEELEAGGQLTVYVTGHGVFDGERPLLLLADAALTPGALAGRIRQLGFERLVFVADHCYAGAFARAFSGAERPVTAIAATDGLHETNCVFFGRPFWRAVGRDEFDADGDGTVSVAEAFTAASEALRRSRGPAGEDAPVLVATRSEPQVFLEVASRR
jgi:thiol-disulfide isomerase/thioredoxin